MVARFFSSLNARRNDPSSATRPLPWQRDLCGPGNSQHNSCARMRLWPLRRLLVLLAVSLLVGLAQQPLWAVIQVLMPLQGLIKDSDAIFLTKVSRIDPERPAAVLEVGESLKGKPAFTRLPINLTGDKEKHTPELLKRIGPEAPVIVFARQQKKNEWMGLAFTNGTWFQILGTTDGDQTRWAFTHCETYLRRTFKGTTAELQATVAGVVTGTKKAPPPDPKEPPGFGPVWSEKKN